MIGRILYGGAFCVLLPALAVLWCAGGEAMMPGWPMPIWWAGVPVAALGAWLIAAAGGDAAGVVERLNAAVLSHAGGTAQVDDVTIVAIKRARA